MADFYSTQYQATHVDVPPAKLDVGYQGARVRRTYAAYTKPTGAELAIGDIVYLMQLPTNARVIDGRVIAETDGTTGQFNIGWLGNGTEALDADGFFTGSAVDVGAGAVAASMLGTIAGYNKKFSAVTDVVITVAEATTAWDAKTIQVELLYVLD
jgi:hypothetical protein